MKAVKILMLGVAASCIPIAFVFAGPMETHTYTCPSMMVSKTYSYGDRFLDQGGSGYWYLWTQNHSRVTIPDYFNWMSFQVVDHSEQNYIQLFCTSNEIGYHHVLTSTNMKVYNVKSCTWHYDGTFTCYKNN